MEKYRELLMGLLVGIVLIMMNNTIVHNSVSSIITGFNPFYSSDGIRTILQWSSRIIVFLSFIGVIITIVCCIMILIKILAEKKITKQSNKRAQDK